MLQEEPLYLSDLCRTDDLGMTGGDPGDCREGGNSGCWPGGSGSLISRKARSKSRGLQAKNWWSTADELVLLQGNLVQWKGW